MSDVQLLFWTCDDVAARLRCSRRQLDYLRKRDDFPKSVTLLGKGHPRFLPAQIIAWAESQPVEA